MTEDKKMNPEDWSGEETTDIGEHVGNSIRRHVLNEESKRIADLPVRDQLFIAEDAIADARITATQDAAGALQAGNSIWVAFSMLSDAQEAVEMGMGEQGNQIINAVKVGLLEAIETHLKLDKHEIVGDMMAGKLQERAEHWHALLGEAKSG